jgi:hypothetical protein
MSVLAERLIRAGLEKSGDPWVQEESLALVVEAVRRALAEHVEHREQRLAVLLARTLIASDTTRRLLFAHMARQWGGADQIRLAHDSARTASINALRDRGWADMVPHEAEDPVQ